VFVDFSLLAGRDGEGDGGIDFDAAGFQWWFLVWLETAHYLAASSKQRHVVVAILGHKVGHAALNKVVLSMFILRERILFGTGVVESGVSGVPSGLVPGGVWSGHIWRHDGTEQGLGRVQRAGAISSGCDM